MNQWWINRAVLILWNVRAHVRVPCVVLFVYLYINVCLSCVYKYIFCTECTKGLGLAKSIIRPALYFCLTNTSHSWRLPNPYRASPHVCLKGSFVAWATTLHVRIYIHLVSLKFSIMRLFCCSRPARQMKTVASLVFPSTFLTRPGCSFQNSTLCKAPVCVSPFHPNDCNKREQMEHFD